MDPHSNAEIARMRGEESRRRHLNAMHVRALRESQPERASKGARLNAWLRRKPIVLVPPPAEEEV